MSISEIQIGQTVTLEHWFGRKGNGDDFTIITGIVTRKLEYYGIVELDVTSCLFGWFTGRRLWTNSNSVLINNNN